MKRYFLKKNHQEVKVGSTVKITKETTTKYGVGETTVSFKMTEKDLEELIKEGLVYVKKDKHDIDYYISRLAHTLEVDNPFAYLIIELLKTKRPTYVIQLLLKEISESMNSYENFQHFPFLYIVSLRNGDVLPITNTGLNYKSVALFVTRKDAEEAKEILKPLFDKVFHESKQENIERTT